MAEDIQARLAEAAKFHASGDSAAAADIYRGILRYNPRQQDALLMMGVVAQQANNPQLALKFIEIALDAAPRFARAWFDRSVVLRMMGRDSEALDSARFAIKDDPDLAAAWDMMGQLLKNLGCYGEAEICHFRAIALHPDNSHFYGNYASLLQIMGNLPGAYRAAHKAERLDPSFPPLLLGGILKSMGYPERAAQRFAQSRALHPSFPDVAAQEGMARLQIGEWEEGWKLWERRPELESTFSALQVWQGEKIGRLLLYEDQGFGDAIQFMRYIPLLKDRVAKIFLHIRDPLRRLCAENFPDVEIVDDGALPLFDMARCRFSSLPALFATRLDTIPAAPYLKAHAGRGRSLSAIPPRIGVAWAGNPKFRHDAARSAAFAAFDPLFACGAAHFVSLQKNCTEDNVQLVALGGADASSSLEDFSDTAGIIAGLDLVIAVDTAVAHLAAAMGKPVWILLPFDSDWRWMLGRQDSPWYPTATLFRQKKPGDWAGVIEQLSGVVRHLIAGDCAVLVPPLWNGESLRQNPHALPLDS